MKNYTAQKMKCILVSNDDGKTWKIDTVFYRKDTSKDESVFLSRDGLQGLRFKLDEDDERCQYNL